MIQCDKHDSSCRGGLQRHHEDGNPFNNHPSNIGVLCRRHHEQEHRKRGAHRGEGNPRAILTEAIVLQARADHAAGRETCVSMAQKYGVSDAAIRSAVKRHTWKHI